MGGSVGTIYGYEYEIFIQRQKIKQNLIDISCLPPPPPKTTKPLTQSHDTSHTHHEMQTRTHALLGRKKKRRDTPYYFNQSPTRHARNRFKIYMRAKFNHNYTMPE